MKQQDPQFKLRLPQALKANLERSAAIMDRTLTGEIVERLEVSFAQQFDNRALQAEVKELHDEVDLLKDALWQSNKALSFQSKLIDMLKGVAEQPEANAALLPVLKAFADEVKLSIKDAKALNEYASAEKRSGERPTKSSATSALLKSMFAAEAAVDPSEENLHSTKVKTSLIEGLEQFANAKEPNRGPVPRKRKRPS